MKNAKEPIVLALASIYGFAAPCAHAEILADATVIQGVNTAGTVRVNCLANLEALIYLVTNLGGFVQISTGAVMLYKAIKLFCTKKDISKYHLAAGITLIVSGLLTPGMVNFAVAAARDANLFN